MRPSQCDATRPTMLLVADVGGTNTRIALSDGAGQVCGRVISYANDDHASFCDLLAADLSRRSVGGISAACVAIAGPVTSGTARLTNRDWVFDRTAIAAMLNGADVLLINDLAALGYAVPLLADDQVTALRPVAQGARHNSQALVIGMGTGVNVCLTKRDGAGQTMVVEAEAGHASLPASVMTPLAQAIGDRAAAFTSIETLFAGRGISALYSAISGGEALVGRAVVDAAQRESDPAAVRTTALLAELAAYLTRAMIYTYLPLSGVFFAGSVARGLLTSRMRPVFLDALADPQRGAPGFSQVPVALITDDAAALTGCAARGWNHLNAPQ